MDYPELRVVLHASMLVASGSPRLLVRGDAGSLIKHRPDSQECQLVAGVMPGAPGCGEDPDGLEIYDGSGAVVHAPAVAGDQRRFYQAVAASIAKGAIGAGATLEAVRVLACLEAALTSARTGVLVALLLSPEERGV